MYQIGELKDIAETIQAFATVAAIIIGGFWSYMFFVRRRQKYPRAEIKHTIEQRKLIDDKLLLHIASTVTSIGEVLLKIEEGQVRLQQIVPVEDPVVLIKMEQRMDPVKKGETEVRWQLLGHREWKWKRGELEIEPQESEVLHCDFIVEPAVQTAEVYTYIKNRSKKKEIGWSCTNICDIMK